MTETQIQCSYCARKRCFVGDLSQAPDYCPTLAHKDIIKASKEKLKEPETKKLAQDVARTWKDYGKLTRIEETVLYARLQGHKKLGVAFCVGLAQEAELLTNLLFNDGFDEGLTGVAQRSDLLHGRECLVCGRDAIQQHQCLIKAPQFAQYLGLHQDVIGIGFIQQR